MTVQTRTARLEARISPEASIIWLSVEDQRLMMEAMLNPPEPNAALRKAADAHRRLVVKSR
jgi:uncharacterized protein (DUF1778 family)